MNRFPEFVYVVLIGAATASCGGQSSSGPLTPKGHQCPVEPPGACQVDAQRSDAERLNALKALSDALLADSHSLHATTLAGGEEDQPLGAHVRSVAVMFSKWEMEAQNGAPGAARREPGGDLQPLARRIRCAADKLVEIGASAPEPELVCWCQELWRTTRAYSRMPEK